MAQLSRVTGAIQVLPGALVSKVEDMSCPWTGGLNTRGLNEGGVKCLRYIV